MHNFMCVTWWSFLSQKKLLFKKKACINNLQISGRSERPRCISIFTLAKLKIEVKEKVQWTLVLFYTVTILYSSNTCTFGSTFKLHKNGTFNFFQWSQKPWVSCLTTTHKRGMRELQEKVLRLIAWELLFCSDPETSFFFSFFNCRLP